MYNLEDSNSLVPACENGETRTLVSAPSKIPDCSNRWFTSDKCWHNVDISWQCYDRIVRWYIQSSTDKMLYANSRDQSISKKNNILRPNIIWCGDQSGRLCYNNLSSYNF